MPLIYACIAPHAGDLIDEADKITLTRKSINAMVQSSKRSIPK